MESITKNSICCKTLPPPPCPKKLTTTVKERILQLCAERGLTINKLSTISGVTQSTVNNVVGGRNNSTTVSTLQKLCGGLGITIIDFFNDDLFKDIEPEVK